jgi:hypothetical protein
VRQLIAVGGKAGAGKDWILDRLLAYEAGQHGVTMKSGFGDLVRHELGIKDPKQYRDKQQAHGQLRRAQDEDYWTKKAVEWGDWATTIGGADMAGFTGVRFENELDVLKDGGFYLVLVEAPSLVREARLRQRDGRWWTQEELNHPTETALDLIPRWKWDAIIWNA